jgi:hypothetical protein
MRRVSSKLAIAFLRPGWARLAGMNFTKRLREPVQRGEITCSVRIWMRPMVTAGKRYPMGDGELAVDSIQQIELADITPELARGSGFNSVIDLLKIAKHGSGSNVSRPLSATSPPGKPAARAKPKRAQRSPRGAVASSTPRVSASGSPPCSCGCPKRSRSRAAHT